VGERESEEAAARALVAIVAVGSGVDSGCAVVCWGGKEEVRVGERGSVDRGLVTLMEVGSTVGLADDAGCSSDVDITAERGWLLVARLVTAALPDAANVPSTRDEGRGESSDAS
jgi:hypothetical protein